MNHHFYIQDVKKLGPLEPPPAKERCTSWEPVMMRMTTFDNGRGKATQIVLVLWRCSDVD